MNQERPHGALDKIEQILMSHRAQKEPIQTMPCTISLGALSDGMEERAFGLLLLLLLALALWSAFCLFVTSDCCAANACFLSLKWRWGGVHRGCPKALRSRDLPIDRFLNVIAMAQKICVVGWRNSRMNAFCMDHQHSRQLESLARYY